MRYKLLNKTYQSFQLIINNQVYILEGRGGDNTIIISDITPQIKKMIDKGYLRITKK